MIHPASRSKPPPLAVAAGLPLTDADGEADDLDLLLSQSGTLRGSRALIMAEHGLDLLGGLIRRGCLAATCLRPSARPEVSAYDLVFFADITPDTALERVILGARRAIVPGGRLIARVTSDPTGSTARGLARRLKLNGFTGVRTQTWLRWSLVRADLPPTGAAPPSAQSWYRGMA